MPPFQELEEIPLEPKPYHPTTTWMLLLGILALGGAIYLTVAELQFYVSAAVATDAETAGVIDGEYGAAQALAQSWIAAQQTEDKKKVEDITKKLDFKLPSQASAKAAAPGGRPGTPPARP